MIRGWPDRETRRIGTWAVVVDTVDTVEYLEGFDSDAHTPGTWHKSLGVSSSLSGLGCLGGLGQGRTTRMEWGISGGGSIGGGGGCWLWGLWWWLLFRSSLGEG
jgi:hypothetical protein